MTAETTVYKPVCDNHNDYDNGHFISVYEGECTKTNLDRICLS